MNSWKKIKYDFKKFIHSDKATFCEISSLLLSNVVPVKSKVDISQNFVAISEYMNFNWLGLIVLWVIMIFDGRSDAFTNVNVLCLMAQLCWNWTKRCPVQSKMYKFINLTPNYCITKIGLNNSWNILWESNC